MPTAGRFVAAVESATRSPGPRSVTRAGPYRWIRHPSYTGILLLLVGIGLAFGNWLSILCLATLPTIGLVLRIRTEEAALLTTLGTPYAQYAATKPHLLPGIW